MVQKKAPDKHGSPAEPKRSHAKPEKRLYSHQHHHQDGRGGGGGGDLKKMLKKSRSIKVLEESLESPLGTQLVQLGRPPVQKKKRPSALGFPDAEPNYMKSTSSSNAKKEQAQVSSSSPKNNTKPSDHLKKPKPPSPGGASGLKPAKFLARKSSLRPVRPPMKKILGIPLCPKINASRATCSSTMKETKFPGHLDLDPGGTEAEGTSVLKVCPYTYCSLNGHRHAPLPPLKCFLSARRRLLKTQKSMKLRALSSFRKAGSEKEEMEIDTGQTESPGVSSLVEDLGDDFFVEIYSKCPKDASAPVGGGEDDAHPVAVDGMASAGDGGEDCDAKIEDDEESPVDDSGSQITSDDSFDQISEFSPSEMEVLVNFLEFVECDTEGPPCPAQDHGDYWSWDCCGVGGGLAEEEGGCEPVSEAADLDWEEDEGLYIDFDEMDYSEFAEDESSDGLGEDVLGGISTLPLDGCEEDAEEIVAENECGTAFEEQEAEAVGLETEDPIAEGNTEPIGDPFFGDDVDGKNSYTQVEDAEPCEETTADEIEDVSGIDKLFSDEEKRGKVETEQNEASNTEMETWESEVGEESQVFEEMLVDSDDELSASSELSTATSTECPQDDAAITFAATTLVEEEHTDTSNNSRARAMVTRKNANGDEEEEPRPFNPRAPNFLPVEPDPEAEKVDLRHQLMDERKNSEEWMVDYALRQAVDKLAPGRKRKVALLVEAFETVSPVPSYGSQLGHSTVGFAHARPIQACS